MRVVSQATPSAHRLGVTRLRVQGVAACLMERLPSTYRPRQLLPLDERAWFRRLALLL